MRRILLMTAAIIIGASPALAQTTQAPADIIDQPVVEAIVEAPETLINTVEAPEVLEQVVEGPEIVVEPREASWYGKPLAADGYDMVALRTGETLAAGSEVHTAQYDNTEWRFQSAENRDEFLKNPEAYVPEFGGYCPVYLSKGQFKVGSARNFAVVDDKLYFNVNRRAERTFENDPQGYIAGAKITF